MKQNLYNYYFVLIKLTGLLAFFGAAVVLSEETITEKCTRFPIMALFILAAVMTELAEKQKQRLAFVAGEGILGIAGVFLFPVTGLFFLAVFFLDLCSFCRVRVVYFTGVYLLLFFCDRAGISLVTCFLLLTVLLLFYLQEKVAVARYREIIEENEVSEGKLKSTMERSDRYYQNEIQRSHLKVENQVLEERDRISQALHDKLGHSINGSLYKLEAAKLLMEKKPEEAEVTLQEVIDNLRGSMDEIRVILRRERPDKKRMALLSLQLFCSECEEKYGISVKLDLQNQNSTQPEPQNRDGSRSGKQTRPDGQNADNSRQPALQEHNGRQPEIQSRDARQFMSGLENITEEVWEVILDNAFEAVTNALKYAECKNITITIVPMNEVVRCTIRDDGNGALEFTEGMGISGMKKRVRSIQGFFDVETEPGMGFCINMILPVNAGNSALR